MAQKPSLKKLNWQLFLFGLVKIPMIGFCRPRVVSVDDNHIRVRIPFRRRTKNHVGSMYLGVMSVGADLASGFLAFYIMEARGLKAAPVFGSMKAEYLKKALGPVDFVCESGKEIAQMLDEAKATGERITWDVRVNAICNEEIVAHFDMGLSLKLLN